MKPMIFPMLLCMAFTSLSAQAYDPFIVDLMAQVSLDSLLATVRILSGEEAVQLGDSTVVIQHRVDYWGNDLAAEFVGGKLASYGLAVESQVYSDYGRNIYAQQVGILDDDRHFILCAHYDAVDYHCADDNASGVAAVLEVARILSHYTPNYTVVYALWDEEEIGLLGSSFYAHQARAHNLDIQGVLNLEMFGWDSDDDGAIDIHSCEVGKSRALAQLLVTIDSLYALPLQPVIHDPGSPDSDHGAFWEQGFGAIVFGEAYWADDFNPYYHSSQDRIDKFNTAYFLHLTKLTVAAIAALAYENPEITAVPNEALSVPETLVLKNYPNPFNASTVIQYRLPEDEHVVLTICSSLGVEVVELLQGFQRAGNYEIRFTAADLPSGVYFATLRTRTRVQSQKIILLK
ncbi:M28 family peptidase [candidate division KSB1 bacterium]|nr:M28 family peptidase [candidate division KSB1 bacterium]